MHWLHVRPNSDSATVRHFLGCFLASFQPKFFPKIRKKGFFVLEFLPNVAKYLANNPMESEDLPKLSKKGEKNPKVCRIPNLPLNFGRKNLQKICL